MDPKTPGADIFRIARPKMAVGCKKSKPLKAALRLSLCLSGFGVAGCAATYGTVEGMTDWSKLNPPPHMLPVWRDYPSLPFLGNGGGDVKKAKESKKTVSEAKKKESREKRGKNENRKGDSKKPSMRESPKKSKDNKDKTKEKGDRRWGIFPLPS